MIPTLADADWLNRKPLIGVVGLRPLPGSHEYGGEALTELSKIAVGDAKAYESARFDAVMLQNLADLPVAERVGPETVAWMTAIGQAVRVATKMPLGVSVLKNDGPAALAIAQAIGAEFVRVKVWVGAMVGAEGIVQGCAREVLQYRRRIGAERIAIWADVHDRSGVPLVPMTLEHAAHEAVSFGKADALVITGGSPPETLHWLSRVRAVLPGTPLVVGGGASLENLEPMLRLADGIIVATSVKIDRNLSNGVDTKAAHDFMARAGSLRTALAVGNSR